MSRQLALWGGPEDDDAAAFIEKCADAGVTRLIGPRSPVVVEAGRARGIEVHPYIDTTAFADYNVPNLLNGWSLAFLRPPVDSPEAREILDNHRPIWDDPTLSEPVISDFAAEHPEYWSRNREGATASVPGLGVSLSLAFPEVRAHRIDDFMAALIGSGGGGIQVELVLGTQDEDGVAPYGYEEPSVSEFQKKHGKSPFDLLGDDPDWMQFRADYLTLFLKELREQVKEHDADAIFSTTLIAKDPEDYAKALQDWPAWVEQGLVDEFYVWWRTDSDLEALERQARHAAEVVDGKCPFIAELSCYHPGSFQEPELMLEGARIARASGADGVGIYRSDPVEQLDFWPVLKQMGKI